MERQEMTLNKLLTGSALVLAVIFSTLLLAPAESRPQPAAAAFDHSNCQYPERWTNPVDGCDNSDPAVPECIKAFSTEQGEKDCIDAFVKANKGTVEKRQAIEEHNKPFETAPEPVQCGGK
jgi:hypothetical protein